MGKHIDYIRQNAEPLISGSPLIENDELNNLSFSALHSKQPLPFGPSSVQPSFMLFTNGERFLLMPALESLPPPSTPLLTEITYVSENQCKRWTVSQEAEHLIAQCQDDNQYFALSRYPCYHVCVAQTGPGVQELFGSSVDLSACSVHTSTPAEAKTRRRRT